MLWGGREEGQAGQAQTAAERMRPRRNHWDLRAGRSDIKSHSDRAGAPWGPSPSQRGTRGNAHTVPPSTAAPTHQPLAQHPQAGSGRPALRAHLEVGQHLGGGGLEVELHQELEQVVDLQEKGVGGTLKALI